MDSDETQELWAVVEHLTTFFAYNGVAANESSPIVATSISATSQPSQTKLNSLPLTPREREVLGLLSKGLPNKAIANALGGCSEGTVRKHVSAILRKLGVNNRTEAAVMTGMR